MSHLSLLSALAFRLLEWMILINYTAFSVHSSTPLFFQRQCAQVFRLRLEKIAQQALEFARFVEHGKVAGVRQPNGFHMTVDAAQIIMVQRRHKWIFAAVHEQQRMIDPLN